VAVATANGLITPIIPTADLKGLVAISTLMKTLAAKAQEGKLALNEFQVRSPFPPRHPHAAVAASC
jgi:pyruvate dehydrogenase E2 component (dihydrolipoamide acetyltransferase)